MTDTLQFQPEKFLRVPCRHCLRGWMNLPLKEGTTMLQCPACSRHTEAKVTLKDGGFKVKTSPR